MIIDDNRRVLWGDIKNITSYLKEFITGRSGYVIINNNGNNYNTSNPVMLKKNKHYIITGIKTSYFVYIEDSLGSDDWVEIDDYSMGESHLYAKTNSQSDYSTITSYGNGRNIIATNGTEVICRRINYSSVYNNL